MEGSHLQAPFFVIDGQDVMFCRSLEDLERFVEPIDAPSTQAYDGIGRIVQLTAVTVSKHTVTRGVPTSAQNPEALERALKRFLHAVDPAVDQLLLGQIVKDLDRFGVRYS